jgi:hypothetical protein
MSKSRKIDNKAIYDEIRKPTPKPGYAFKSKKQKFRDGFDDEFDDLPPEIDQKTITKLKQK